MKPAWKPIKVKLGQIRAWDKNPRMSTKAQAQRIIASERKFGQPVPFLVSPDFLLYDGHQRLAAWFTVYGAVILERFFTATGITPELVE